MNVDEKTNIYNQGFLSGQEHSKTSPQTFSLLKEVEKEYVNKENCQEKSKNILNLLKGLDKKVNDIDNELIEFIRKNIFMWIIGGVCTFIVLSLNFVNTSLNSELNEMKEQIINLQQELRGVEKDYNDTILKLNEKK